MPKTRKEDPFELERRLETQIHLHLLEMEEHPEMFPPKDRLSAITTIGMWLNRKFGWGEPEDNAVVGSAVRKYRGAFQTHVANQPTGSARPPHTRSRAPATAGNSGSDDC